MAKQRMGRLFNGPHSFMVSHFTVRVDSLDAPWWVLFYGDIHKFAFLHAEEVWAEWLAEAAATPNALFVGMGDMQEQWSSSERKALDNAGLHEGSVGYNNETQLKRAGLICDEMEFMRGKIIGEIEGNHWADVELPDGKRLTTTQYRCLRLGAPYLGAMGFVMVTFRYGKEKHDVIFLLHHGRSSGGYLPGRSLNEIFKLLPGGIADIYAMGHNHETAAARSTRAKLVRAHGKLRVVGDDVLLVRTGNMMKAWVPVVPNYLAKWGKGPLPLSLAAVRLTPKASSARRPGFHMRLHALI